MAQGPWGGGNRIQQKTSGPLCFQDPRDWWVFGRAGGCGKGAKKEGVMARRSLREGENEVRLTKWPRVPGLWPQSIKRY